MKLGRRELNKLGFGLDIDSLESYIVDYEQARYLTDLSLYEHNYKILRDLLFEVKPSSLVFSTQAELEQEKTSEEDIFFIENKNERHPTIYGLYDRKKLEGLKGYIDGLNNGLTDMLSMINIMGLDVQFIYRYGELLSVNLIGECNKYTDITDEVSGSEILPMGVEDLEDFWVTEFRGKLTIPNTSSNLQNISKHIETSVMRCIRCGIHYDALEILVTDIRIKKAKSENGEYTQWGNEWEKMEYVRSIGFDVPYYGLLRGIDSDSLESALSDMDGFFNKAEKSNRIAYKYRGFEARIQGVKPILYNTTDTDSEQLFVSTVKSFKHMSDGTDKLEIVIIQCNDRLLINEIESDDLYVLSELGIRKGSKVVFNVVEGKAILNIKYTEIQNNKHKTNNNGQ